ncbi:MAG: Spy/CpxP family protein refolding chaperone [Azonexus sp.]|jgi:Spy/CpxP family protein refolding chaperone
MTPTALHSETIDIAPFLSISRKYLGLNSADGAGAEVALNPFKRQALTSRTKSNTRRNGMKRYCNLAQSLLLATGLGAVVSSPAFADPGCGNMSRREAHFEHHAKMIEQRHQQLHDALKLSAEQELGWKKFAESEQLKPPPGIDQPEDWSKLSTPERAEKILELSKMHQAHMAEHVAALKAFYATLTPEQKKTFEEFHASPLGGMRSKPRPLNPGADNPSPKS